MSENEFLLALSEMMDEKLDAKLKPIENDIQMMKNDMSGMKNDMADMKIEMADMKNDMADMKIEVAGMKNDIRHLKLSQENIILPRLDTIESCYLDTYNRYKAYADRMEAAFTDIALMKKVITEHSGKLQKLA